ncbi:glyoxalase superfamily protein [Paenibacillus paeoniae]|uniref:VOC family protein n=1 Tax=Paenibacillus paeoniae TaxID=2292705 RepID=A0A371PKD6_9BACL|nr:glyoxalase superfamily protein [Paenibacillus paeoniae]REK76661.1 VOC family protein [Paenibacillus paeoniae]
MEFKGAVPILRIFDEGKAKEFYVSFLEFTWDWEHRYESQFPLYAQVSKGGCVLHLSEHHGDCTPGAAVRIEVEDAKAWQEKLVAKLYGYARPGFSEEWNSVQVTDPFGNKLHFYSTNNEN